MMTILINFHIETDRFLQSSGLPLIDRNNNFVVYDVRINDVLADYIIDNNLLTHQGQQAYLDSGQEIDFPMGYYDNPLTKRGGLPGSAAIKSAWKVIDVDSGDDPSKYYTVNGRISVSKSQSASGEPFCLRVRLGLVGMHIMTRTRSGNGNKWIWTTFEHIDNAPLATNARKPQDMLHEELFEGGCQAPKTLEREYSFFSAQCPDCKTNQYRGREWKWALHAPHARSVQQNPINKDPSGSVLGDI